jgi:hypothetical protein
VLRKPESDALSQKESGINETDSAKLPDLVLWDLANSLNRMVQQSASRIETELQNPALKHRPNIGVNQPESRDSSRNQPTHLHELEDGNQTEQAGIFMVHLNKAAGVQPI